jgi:hypothetical protein
LGDLEITIYTITIDILYPFHFCPTSATREEAAAAEAASAEAVSAEAVEAALAEPEAAEATKAGFLTILGGCKRNRNYLSLDSRKCKSTWKDSKNRKLKMSNNS